jgi:hypothetical protein
VDLRKEGANLGGERAMEGRSAEGIGGRCECEDGARGGAPSGLAWPCESAAGRETRYFISVVASSVRLVIKGSGN